MSSVLNFPASAIRKVTGLDFGYIRKLPVQLTQPPAGSLLLKQLRMMMQVPDHELAVADHEKHIAGFIALQYSPSRDSGVRFLVIRFLAVDRFALTRGIAAELEQHACLTAAATGCKAVLVRAASLNRPALLFYQERGYRLDGDTLIKNL